MVNMIDKILKYLSMNAVIGSPNWRINNATRKKRADRLMVEASRNMGKLTLKAPAEMVMILKGMGVKPAVKTIKKL